MSSAIVECVPSDVSVEYQPEVGSSAVIEPLWTIEGGTGAPQMLLWWLAVAKVDDAEVPNIDDGGEGGVRVGVGGVRYDS